MKAFRFFLTLIVFAGSIYFLSTGHTIGGTAIPPLGYFLNPFHGYLQNGENMDPDVSEIVELADLSAPVQVSYDSNLVPYIFAENDRDLYYVQGYVVAKLRLWQLEFQAMAAAGRISEIIGERGIDIDRIQRRTGLMYGAEKVLEWMEKQPELKSSIDAYTQGVNDYVASLGYRDYPIEYKLLNYSPEGWEPIKTALVLQYLNHMLTGFDQDIENTNFVSLFGKSTYDRLFPDWMETIEPVVPTFSPWAFDTLSPPALEISYDSVDILQFARPDPRNGSNNWAISGAKTASGKPLLSNDTHLGLNLPSLWITLQLKSPDLHVGGLVFTGAPGIVIGFNDSTAWGFTNAPRDNRDWYSIRFKDDSKSEYWYDSTWRSSSTRIENIKVRNSEDFLDTVVYTHHGPVVYDKSFPGNNSTSDLALRWIGHSPSRIFGALYRLNRANNYDQYKEAVEEWDSPPQNIVFASTNGDIALRIEGTFPLKWKEQGKFILDGSNPQHEWQEFIPHSQNAFLKNPERNFVSSANQHAVDPQYPFWTYNPSQEYYRNRIINRLLTEMDSVSRDDFMKMPLNRYNIKAEEILPLFMDSVKRVGLSQSEMEILHQLSTWNYVYDPNETDAVFFEMWWAAFRSLLWDELRASELPLRWSPEYTTYYLLANNLLDDFLDIRETPVKENFSDLVTLSLQRVIGRTERWKSENTNELNWKYYNNVKLTHIARVLAPFDSEVLATGGSRNSILAAGGNHGPSQRMIVDLDTEPRAWIVYPGGQSGNPGSKHYLDLADDYVSGNYFELFRWDSPPKDLPTQTFNPSDR